MSQTYDIAVLGATGAVGETILSILAERGFPVGKLYPLGSQNSEGKMVMFNDQAHRVLNAANFDFSKAQIGLFSAGGSVSAVYAPKAAEAGCVVIDNTSHFRYDVDVPLVIPEVNSEKIADYKQRNIIANPNCSTIQMLVAIKPIYDAVGISRINVATYQSVSGAGGKGVTELAGQTANLLNGESGVSQVFNRQIAFNVLPQIDVFEDNGYTREEMKMFWETQKILGDSDIVVNATAVRVPVFYGHSEALHIETRNKLTAAGACELLLGAPGVILLDDTDYPTAVSHAAAEDAVYVSRVREDVSHPLGLDLWVVADNIRKGAALNAVQIAEILIENYL